MANEFSISDKGEQYSPLQSILYQEDLDILVAGIAGTECVLSGGVVTAQGSPDMTVAVAKAATLSLGVMFATAAGSGIITAADATLSRIDLVVINSAGAIAVRAGTPAAYPLPPVRTAGDVALARVFVQPKTTQIKTENITPLRMVRNRNITIYKTTVVETTNTTAAAIEALNKANSGVTIPSGVFLAGRRLRVRMGGNILQNSGTVAVSLAVRYGGTTMFNDTSAATVADADRRAWFLEFDLMATSNVLQAMVGHLQLQDLQVASTAPATGIGDVFGLAGTTEGPTPMVGSAAVDSDAADRLLSVIWTLGTSSASVELVVGHATVELV